MSVRTENDAAASHLQKENKTMSKRLAILAISIGALLVLLLPAAPASAASPWWQIVTGSRPSNLWEPEDNVQELSFEVVDAEPFGETLYVPFQVGGNTVGCFGVGSFGAVFCGFSGAPLVESAADLKPILESAYGGPVEVTGGPVGAGPMTVTVPGRNVPPIAFTPFIGQASNDVIASGGSGRLVVTVTNLGDERADATNAPLTIVDELPEGVEVTGFEAFGGTQGTAGPVDCTLEGGDLVICVFEGVLEQFDSIEIEMLVNLTGSPPVAGAPGEVTVSGANGRTASEPQPISVSPDPVPFGIERFSSKIEAGGGFHEANGGEHATQAGGHPFQLTTNVQFNAGKYVDAAGGRTDSRVEQPAQPRDVEVSLPNGFVGNPSGQVTCKLADFYDKGSSPAINACPDAAAVGVASVSLIVRGGAGFLRIPVPIFNLTPAAGEPVRLGFSVLQAPTLITTAVDPDDDYRIIASVENQTQLPVILAANLTIWGAPGDPRHDEARGWGCVYTLEDVGPCERPAGLSEDAFFRQPVSCATPVEFRAEAEPWNVPFGTMVDQRVASGPTMTGCNQVPFAPEVAASASAKLADNPSGLEYALSMPNKGLSAQGAIAEAQPKRVEVTLPAGMTINPSQAEGLATCSPAQFAAERYDSVPGAGCPSAAKLAEVQISTPLLSEEARGSIYIAAPYDNPFGSLIALYLVARIPERGILVKQAGRVDLDPETGQITTVFDDLPQLPYSDFEFRFRSGGRAPLVTPPTCGTHEILTRFVPWSAQDPERPTPEEIVTRTSSFEIERGVDGGPCPSGGTPPFHPDLQAGTENNAAGSFSPFLVKLTRKDGEQEITNFSIKLPPGVAGKLAGIPFCTDAQIAQASARKGPHGGQEELDDPSCPASSQVGRSLAGSGVGQTLAYAPGKLYLAGPYKGAPISFVSITSGVVGPFDIGTVVVRLAIKVNPETGEVFLDSTGSDPIPHIIKGVVLHLRDVRAYTDRPGFTFNPTSCEPTSTSATVLGSGLDIANPADDKPFISTSPFQAADCAALPFKPRLTLRLKGTTRRAGNPALHAHLKMNGFGEAGLAYARTALPKTLFLDNAHIGTVCTRVQFRQGAVEGEMCPRRSIIGRASASTPILDRPLTGPIYLRSNPERELPDIAASLQGSKISIVAVGHTDSTKGGGLRNTFEVIPDAPVDSVDINLFGGKRGLIESSRNLCSYKPRARVELKGHNGKARNYPKLRIKATGCKKKAKRPRSTKHRRH